MLTVNDALDAVLLGGFFFGLICSVVLLFVGDGGVLADLPGLDFGGDGEGGVPINLSKVLAFIAWFGGVAYLARNAAAWSPPFALGAGAVGGLLGAAAIGWVMSKLVSASDVALDPAAFRLPGTIARVTSSIRDGGTGEVVYEQHGVRQVSAARAKDGRAIPRGSEVVLVQSRNGIALVERSEEFFGDGMLGVGQAIDREDARTMHPSGR